MNHYLTVSRRYMLQSLILTVLITLIGFVGAYLSSLINLLMMPISVSAVFCLLTSISVGILWRMVGSKQPGMLTTFYTAVSGFRMLLALVVLSVVYAIVGRSQMLPYVITFMVYYFIVVGHQSVFFAKHK